MLVIVLWMMSLLAVLAASFSNVMRTESTLALAARQEAEAHALTEAGLRYAVSRLQEDDPETQLPKNGHIVTWRFAGSRVKISVVNERGLISLNKASRGLLESLFRWAGMSKDPAAVLAASVIDWRDSNDAREVNGAEDPDYKRAGLEYGAKDAAFDTVEELRQVIGMKQETYEKVVPLVSAASLSQGVNPSLAPYEVLAVLANGKTDRLEEFVRTRATQEDAPVPQFGQEYHAQGQSQFYRIRVQAPSTGEVSAYEEFVIAPQADRQPPYFVKARLQPIRMPREFIQAESRVASETVSGATEGR